MVAHCSRNNGHGCFAQTGPNTCSQKNKRTKTQSRCTDSVAGCRTPSLLCKTTNLQSRLGSTTHYRALFRDALAPLRNVERQVCSAKPQICRADLVLALTIEHCSLNNTAARFAQANHDTRLQKQTQDSTSKDTNFVAE